MLRRLQFTFPEGAISKSCAHQKLSVLQDIYLYIYFAKKVHYLPPKHASRTNSHNIIGRKRSMVIPLLANQDLTPMLTRWRMWGQFYLTLLIPWHFFCCLCFCISWFRSCSFPCFLLQWWYNERFNFILKHAKNRKVQ